MKEEGGLRKMTSKQTHADALNHWKVQDLVFRVEGAESGDFIFYDERKCDGCGGCALVCSAGLWTVPEGRKARLAPKYRELCLECAACHAVCVRDAIEFRYPKGGSGIIIKHG
jgi:ferredoxin like protein